MEKLIGILIAAHLIVDFFLCDDVRLPGNRWFRFLHAIAHASCSYILLQEWTNWLIPALVLVVHFVIDSVPWYRSKPATEFVINQIAHVISLWLLVWLWQRFTGISGFSGIGYETIIILAGFIATVRGVACYIGRFAAPLIAELRKDNKGNTPRFEGLRNGGKLIGELERSLIFLLVFIDQPMGIGFLVAAKSILRFEEAKNQKLAEYVLIGTLLSFLLAIVMAMLTRWAMNL